uniref:BCAR1 scaffold protein, Cas family member n=1 Tax=Anas platyrhynchos TaxID=8839 RepID=A0A8B9TQM6_ANAPL
MNYLNVLAKALYDNVAESPDELSFRKGDIMTVLERNTQGLDGWWLCSLHGRQGIVPGNRLKILQGAVRPSGECRALPPSHALGAAGTHTPERSPQCPLVPLQVYDVPPSVSKDVPDGPVREETYDVPPAFAKQKAFDPTRHPLVLTQQEPYLPEDVYDVPPAAGKCAPEPSLSHEIYDVPPSLKKLSSFPSQEVYDVPRDLHGPSKGSGKEEFEKTQKELLEKGNIIRQSKDQLEHQQLKQFERLEQEVTRPIDNDLSNWSPPQHYGPARGGGALCASDRQLLLFYLEQCEANLTTLTNAVDAFFTAVSTNQPPKIFVAHSKFIILSAHKLVFIGDTLSRQAKAQEVRHKVTHYSNLLCEMLKEIVVTTKAAALHYPSPAASKDMVERVKDLANSTQQFRMVLGQLAAM